MSPFRSTIDPLQPHLQTDCSQCFGLCCVALPYAKSADFPCDKPGGSPCRHLQKDYRCGIHDSLRKQGYKGCTVYDCFGAGERVSKLTFHGRSWREDGNTAPLMLAVFPIMQQLHEIISYLREILAGERTATVHEEAGDALTRLEAWAGLPPEELLALDLAAVRAAVNETLLEASRLVRQSGVQESGRSAGALPARKDFMGANLKGKRWRGTDLRGAMLIAANLQQADLRDCDMIGADLRDADLRGADLRGALFLSQMQVNSAMGDARTKLPSGLRAPAHWA
ncbi:pentapeptide repeat-containing protein [Paenibacillus sp. YN15]|uniref:pentapeptide repeat-containing protein n=1 Tax=Paenibacillus sp. YN15 TaxID=1742774 RepID=UPI000DCB9101|nr:pentapeptide repeat-containing protein [Paenibacillus sp. YN15]RAU99201.1 pentapeptide repeat-containing protein [Paenibacillus sp. YN15]